MAVVVVGDGRHLRPGMLANVKMKVGFTFFTIFPLQHKLWAILKEKNATLFSDNAEVLCYK